MAATPEKKVKDKIKSWYKKNIPDAWVYMPVPMGFGQHGIPDFIICSPKVITQDMVGKTVGIFVGIEAKAIKGKLSKHQVLQLAAIKEASGISFELKAKPEDVHAMLDAIRSHIE